MAERIYNGMIPVMVDMVSATVGPEVGKAIAGAPLGTKPYEADLVCSPRENMKLLLEHKVPKYLLWRVIRILLHQILFVKEAMTIRMVPIGLDVNGPLSQESEQRW